MHKIEALDQERLNALLGKSLLTTQEWDVAELDTVRDLARVFADLDRRGIKTPVCEHELAWAVFFDQSTRTKSAWAGAASRLGMQPVGRIAGLKKVNRQPAVFHRIRLPPAAGHCGGLHIADFSFGPSPASRSFLCSGPSQRAKRLCSISNWSRALPMDWWTRSRMVAGLW